MEKYQRLAVEVSRSVNSGGTDCGRSVGGDTEEAGWLFETVGYWCCCWDWDISNEYFITELDYTSSINNVDGDSGF